jgi:hypothetical protein
MRYRCCTAGLLTEVHKFSKFIHGTATLFPDMVQAVPYWVDDESGEQQRPPTFCAAACLHQQTSLPVWQASLSCHSPSLCGIVAKCPADPSPSCSSSICSPFFFPPPAVRASMLMSAPEQPSELAPDARDQQDVLRNKPRK